MMSARRARVVSWLMPALVVLIAVGGWGYYAWRFGIPDHLPTAEELSPLPEIADRRLSSGPSGATAAPAGQQAADLTEPSAGVTVNTPGSYMEQPEMKLKPGARTPVSEARPRETIVEQSTPPDNAVPSPQLSAQPPPVAPSSADLGAARDALARGDLPAARAALSAVLAHTPAPADEAFARAELERISDALLFSRATNLNDPLAFAHSVGAGESVNSIARQYKIPEVLLVKINRIADPHRLLAGQRLKVIRGPFSAVIDKSRHQMDVYLGDVYVRGFPVGLGANDGTPRGTWVVRNKLTNPEWVDPATGHRYAADDQDNPIGEHWIGMHCIQGECMGRSGFGLHGTIDPSSIGRDSSMGCVRMRPQDIAFVYDLFLEEVSHIVVK